MDYLLLFANCVLVRGASRATICDLQKGDIYPVPKLFADLFIENRIIDIDQLKSNAEGEEREYFAGVIAFLLEHQLAFYCSQAELQHFPRVDTEWLFPAHISHCVLDTATGRLDYFTELFVEQLGQLCCNFIQFRFFALPSITHIESILALVKASQVKSVEILIPWNAGYEKDRTYLELVEEHPKISSLICWGASSNNICREGSNGMGYVLNIADQINNETHCGIIDQGLFAVNITTYTESLSFNSCLNRKISIDALGEIKNCPSMKDSFGNISDTTLSEALSKPGFKKYWNITKDKIAVCSDCEFRHVCTDCRAYVDIPEDEYSKPLKCGYDPYTGTWEEWSENPMKHKAIEAYGLLI